MLASKEVLGKRNVFPPYTVRRGVHSGCRRYPHYFRSGRYSGLYWNERHPYCFGWERFSLVPKDVPFWIRRMFLFFGPGGYSLLNAEDMPIIVDAENILVILDPKDILIILGPEYIPLYWFRKVFHSG
uniref:Uncharacterized protein n=1 Tax=Setaria digitata TaxID=48799 RepID=A0A915PZ86_9BILA